MVRTNFTKRASNRRLAFQSLHARNLMAADIGENVILDSNPMIDDPTITAEIHVDGDSCQINNPVDPEVSGVAEESLSPVSSSDTSAISVQLSPVDSEGNELTEVRVGDEFYLQMIATDLRENPEGVFSIFADVEFNSELAELTGDVDFGDNMLLEHVDLTQPGLVDELGGIISAEAMNQGDVVIGSIPLRATAAGSLTFSSNPADILPDSESTLFGLNDPIDASAIDFGTGTIEVLSVDAPETPADSPMMSIRLTPVDRDGNELTEVRVGDEFEVQMIAKDLRENPQGLFSVFADVEFDPALAEQIDEIDFGDNMWTEHVDLGGPGLVDELGGIVSAEGMNQGDVVIASMTFRATETGSLTFSSNPADVLPDSESTLLGLNDAIDVGAIEFGMRTIEVLPAETQWHNGEMPVDVNGDGAVSPSDALRVINFINEWDAEPLSEIPVDEAMSGYVDTNDDGAVTSIDALLVINELARQSDIVGNAAENSNDDDDPTMVQDNAISELF